MAAQCMVNCSNVSIFLDSPESGCISASINCNYTIIVRFLYMLPPGCSTSQELLLLTMINFRCKNWNQWYNLIFMHQRANLYDMHSSLVWHLEWENGDSKLCISNLISSLVITLLCIFYDSALLTVICSGLSVCWTQRFFLPFHSQTMVTPITEALLDWDEQENSIFYCAAGTEVLSVSSSIGCVTFFEELVLYSVIWVMHISSILYLSRSFWHLSWYDFWASIWRTGLF